MVKLPLFLRTKLGHIQYLFTPFLMGIPHNFTLFLPYNCFLTSPFPSHLPSSLVNLLTLSFDHFWYFVIFVTLWLCDCVILSLLYFYFQFFHHVLTVSHFLSIIITVYLSIFLSFFLSFFGHSFIYSVTCDLSYLYLWFVILWSPHIF